MHVFSCFINDIAAAAEAVGKLSCLGQRHSLSSQQRITVFYFFLFLLSFGSSLGHRLLSMSSFKKQSPYYTTFPTGAPPQLHAPKTAPGGSAEDAWESYHEMYRQSLDEPEKFWTEQSNKYLRVGEITTTIIYNLLTIDVYHFAVVYPFYICAKRLLTQRRCQLVCKRKAECLL